MHACAVYVCMYLCACVYAYVELFGFHIHPWGLISTLELVRTSDCVGVGAPQFLRPSWCVGVGASQLVRLVGASDRDVDPSTLVEDLIVLALCW